MTGIRLVEKLLAIKIPIVTEIKLCKDPTTEEAIPAI
jgi:hypothetical protein